MILNAWRASSIACQACTITLLSIKYNFSIELTSNVQFLIVNIWWRILSLKTHVRLVLMFCTRYTVRIQHILIKTYFKNVKNVRIDNLLYSWLLYYLMNACVHVRIWISCVKHSKKLHNTHWTERTTPLEYFTCFINRNSSKKI